MQCELCERDVQRLTVHHLIPKQKEGQDGPTAEICSACRRQIHVLYDSARLASELNSLAWLRSEPRRQRFLAWVHKQKGEKRVKVRRSANSQILLSKTACNLPGFATYIPM